MSNARIAESLESLDDRLAAALARATDDGIRDFLIQAMADDDRLAARFASRFGEHDARDEAKRLRSDLAAIRKAYARGGFIDYRSSWGFEREYQEALDLHLQPFARKGDAAALFDLLSVAVTHLCGISIDDSDGFTTATFSQLRDYYVAAFSNTPADQVEKRIADVLALAAKLESSPRSQALSWYVVPELLGIPAELFAHDARHASCVIDLCDGRIAQLGERLCEIAKAAERFPVERYQDALLRVDPEFVLARYKADALTWFASAYDRQGYRRESKRLKRLAELPGGKEAAQQVAAELRQRYPRKSALHDELTKAGF